MDRGPSERVRNFFESSIDSVELLHVLMFLHAHPDEVWAMRKISDELRSSEASVVKRVQDLVDRRVFAPEARREAGAMYIPLTGEVRQTIDEAITYYRTYPYRVQDLIFSKRKDPIQSIADAFRFRKED